MLVIYFLIMDKRDRSIDLSTYRNINMPIGTFLRVGESDKLESWYQCWNISILIIYFVIMIERQIFLSSPTLRNVPIGMLMFLRIGIEINRVRISMS